MIKFNVHLKTYIYHLGYQNTYKYVLDVFDKFGIEQDKNINQKKTVVSKNGLQLLDENEPSNILIFKCTYLLEDMGLYRLYGGRIFMCTRVTAW